MIRSLARMARPRCGLLLACATALAWPAAASARSAYTFTFGPLTDHGYKVEGVLTPTTATTYNLGFVFNRKAGAQDQLYVMGYTPSVHARIASNLSSGRLHTSLGSAGSVSLEFRPQGGITKTEFGGTTNLLGCHVPRQLTRSGTAVGSFSFNTHTVFGTIHGHHVAARLAHYPTNVSSCHGQRTMSLELNGPSGPFTTTENFMDVVHTGSMSFATATYQVDSTSTDPFSMEGLIEQTGPHVFSASSNLSSATVSASGPFLSGTARFTETSKCSAHGAFGSIAGSLKAHFLIGGTQVYPSVTTTPITATPPGGSPNPFGVLSTGLVGCI